MTGTFELLASAAATERAVPGPAASGLLARLGAVARGHDGAALADRLGELDRWVGRELGELTRELAALPRPGHLADRAAHHLVALGGKHVRAMCVVLAAKLGTGFGAAACELAVAVELVHGATLLHDDVVDLGEVRRGAPAARAIYGNAAAIFAGDHLLVEALRRIARAGVPGLLDAMLTTIDQMIAAESRQLENRGRVATTLADYFFVIEGKTAALFRWAMRAGALAGGLGAARADELERYGHHLGLAFQAVDDALDCDGSALATGKALWTDLREGKMTYPLIVAAGRSPRLAATLAAITALPAGEPIPPALVAEVSRALATSRALDDCRALARAESDRAIAAIAGLPDSPGKAALTTVAAATAERRR